MRDMQAFGSSNERLVWILLIARRFNIAHIRENMAHSSDPPSLNHVFHTVYQYMVPGDEHSSLYPLIERSTRPKWRAS